MHIGLQSTSTCISFPAGIGVVGVSDLENPLFAGFLEKKQKKGGTCRFSLS